MLEQLAQEIRAARRGPTEPTLFERAADALALDPISRRRFLGRLSRSSNPRWSLLHGLISHLGSSDGGALADYFPMGPPLLGRDEAHLGPLFLGLGLSPQVIEHLFADARLQAFGRGLDDHSAPSDPALALRWAERAERHACPSLEGLKHLATILGDRTPSWLRGVLLDLGALEAMAKGERALTPTRGQLETCLSLIARGWALGQPTSRLGLECTPTPGWFRRESLSAIAPQAGWSDFPIALEAAATRGQSARLRALLSIDRWSPTPASTSTLDPRRHELAYTLTAAAYWWLADRPELARAQRDNASQLALRYGLDPSELPEHHWAGFEAIADGLSLPGDPRNDRLYWWMGQPQAHLELAERLLEEDYGPVFRALHVGSADGSQTLYLAAALDRAIGRKPTRLEVHGVDAGWVPPIDAAGIELDQSHPAYATGWPLLEEELLGDGVHQSGVPFALRTIISKAQLVAVTAESLPFRREAIGRGPRYRRASDRWQLQAPGRRSIRFTRANLFEPDPFPGRDYQLVLLTHVLPWIRMYETGPAAATQAELLRRAMDALRPVLVPGAIIVLDPLSLLEHEGREWRLLEKDPSEGVAYDYGGRTMIDRSPLEGYRVWVVEPEAGLITPEQLERKLRS